MYIKPNIFPLISKGNVQGWEMEGCLEHDLIATVTTEEAVQAMGKALNSRRAAQPNGNNVKLGTILNNIL